MAFSGCLFPYLKNKKANNNLLFYARCKEKTIPHTDSVVQLFGLSRSEDFECSCLPILVYSLRPFLPVTALPQIPSPCSLRLTCKVLI